MHKILFYNKFISCLYMFRAPCAHRQEVKNCIIQSLYFNNCSYFSNFSYFSYFRPLTCFSV